MPLRDGIIIGLGSPLIDIICKVNDELLNKYNLKANSAAQNQDLYSKIISELKNENVEFQPGGSPQNTLRTLSWILKRSNTATFMGCVGKDDNAEIILKKSNEVGLNCVFQIDENLPTGNCLVLVTGNERSLITNPGAANSFNHGFLRANWSHVERAEYVYLTNFFFIVSCTSVRELADFVNTKMRTLILNLSAPFLCQRFKNEIAEVMPFVDILFGNADEFYAIAESLEMEIKDLVGISKLISNMPKSNSKKRQVVITQGADPVISIIGSEVVRVDVPEISQEDIVDTNGAGDAFVGGYLSQLIEGKNVIDCIECGIWASRLIIKQSGCSFP